MPASLALRSAVAPRLLPPALESHSMRPDPTPPAAARTPPRPSHTSRRLAALAQLTLVVAAHALALHLLVRPDTVTPPAPQTAIEVTLITLPAPTPLAPPEPVPAAPQAPAPPPPRPVVAPAPPPKPVLKQRTPRPKPAPPPLAKSSTAPVPAETPDTPPEPAVEAPDTAPETPATATPMEVAAAPAPAAAPPAECSDAGYLYKPDPPYPRLANRMNQQGTSLIQADVASDGAVDNVRLHRSSGYPRLDNAALKAVAGWRFNPARCGNTAKASQVIVPVEFKLEKP